MSNTAVKRAQQLTSTPLQVGELGKTSMYTLRDFQTKEPVQATNLIFTGENGPWEVVMNMEQVLQKINADYFLKSPPFHSKYLPLMPIEDYSAFVSLKEGATPLMKSRRLGEELGINLYFKLESKNPTGAFKDRGSAVELTLAKQLGAKGIVVASTGNMAASCSCYAAAAHIPCFVFVPEDTPTSKLSQSISYGGKIVQVKGTYNDAARLAEQVAKELGFYLAGDYAFRVEGQKTAAFELIDQLYFQVPDCVFVPIGCGTNIAAYAKGFAEYQTLGFIHRTPRLIGVQAEGARSVVNSIEQDLNHIVPLKSLNTIATAIAVTDPLDGLKALEAIRESHGTALAVTDNEMLEAQYRLAREEGLFAECSSAATFAAVCKLAKLEKLSGQTIICVITGDGLKDPSPILKIAIKPPTIYPTVDEFLALYSSSFFESKSISFVDRNEVMFREEPTVEVLSKALTKHFRTNFSDNYVEKIRGIIAAFLKKGKPVTFSDLQDIVQDAIETVTKPTVEQLKIKDFEVQTAKDKKPLARVTVAVNGGEKSAEASGVGPFDALINAVKGACSGLVEFSLKDFKVDIRGQGTDAVVYVEIKLLKGDKISVGHGTSPDIIQASVEALEAAYNGV